MAAGEGGGEAEGEGAGVGDEITLPLLTDREPSPRAREMSSSRWMSNDDASDGEKNPQVYAPPLFAHASYTPYGVWPNAQINLLFSANLAKQKSQFTSNGPFVSASPLRFAWVSYSTAYRTHMRELNEYLVKVKRKYVRAYRVRGC